MLRIRIEDEGPIAALRWRGVPGEDAGLARLQGVAEEAGLGRKVLEVRPPVPIGKGQSVRDLVGASRPHVALFGGSEVTASDVLGALVADGRPGSAGRVGVRSEKGPRGIVVRSGLLAGGAAGFARVLEGLLRAAR